MKTDNFDLYGYIEKQAKYSPNSIAVKYGHESISYKDLIVKASKLSDFIIKNIKKKNRLVGICMESCIDPIISILATLRAGAVYVPIDPNYPEDRIKFIIKDAALDLLLTNSKTAKNKSLKNGIVFLDKISIGKPTTSQKRLFNKLVYVIYTSGSTGKPKGVMVTQDNVINYATWVKDYLNLTGTEIFDCSSSFSFDLTVTTCLVPLLFGTTISLCDQDTKKNPEQYLKYLQENKISIIKITPSYFNLLCDYIDDFELNNLMVVILGGENPSLKHIKKWLTKYKHQKIINEYGPTETTVGVTQETIIFDKLNKMTFVPLGTVGNNMYLKIFNPDMSITTKGNIGELYIEGKCVTNGYLNRKKLTKERFKKMEGGNNCMYKTGDLVKIHSNNQLEYIGRIDDQVKLRGYRIELGEIENQILKYPHIKLAAISHYKIENNGFIVAHYVAEKNHTIDSNKLEKFLRTKLPEYMIPTKLIELSNFSLTVNGKLDKSKLPNPFRVDTSNHNVINQYSKSAITALWCKLTKIDNVNETANFFEIGGNSLILAQFCHKLLKKGLNVKITDLFQFPTLSSLANFLEEQKINDHLNSAEYYTKAINSTIEANNIEIKL